VGDLLFAPETHRPSLTWQPLLLTAVSADKITVEHPSDDLLERYSMGRLTEAETAPLKEHLLICRECRNRGVLMDCDVAAIRDALRQWREEAED
jgi:hypothetical protein